MKQHQAKLQERPFSQRVRSQALFNTNKEVIGEDVPLPHRPVTKRVYTGVTHDANFRPNIKPPRSGYNCTIAKFPEYKCDPPREKIRKVKVEGDPENPPPFKSTYKYRSRPCSSVATNMRNLKASFSSVFRR